MSAATVLMIGDTVDCVIGYEFTPNGRGPEIVVQNRAGGELIAWNENDMAEVRWPNGEVYSYQPNLLRKHAEVVTQP